MSVAPRWTGPPWRRSHPAGRRPAHAFLQPVTSARPAVRAPIDRASPNDLMELASDLGTVPMQIAAVLVLDAESSLGLPAVREAIGERIRGIPRLRQALVRTPPGCGRPVWVDDPRFDIRHHVRLVACPAPGDERALLAVAAEAATDRLPAERPLWSATLVTGLADGHAALIIVIHHVLTDGIGGLAVLAHLVDGVPAALDVDFPRPAPARRQLFADSLGSRLRALAALPSSPRRLRGAIAELRSAGATRPPRCSLNQPTGPRRRLAVARVDLAAVHESAHAHGGTVNDVVLTAVAGTLHTVLSRRGEAVDALVISVPVSARRTADASQLGNQVGAIPVEVPADGDPLARLERIARISRDRKGAPRGASAALLGPAFRVLARLGLLHWFIDRQRLVSTFVTNVRGPGTRLSFLGVPITEVIPVSALIGNVTVVFAVLSYAGTLTVTAVADPDQCHELPMLVRELQGELDALVRPRVARRRS